MRIHAELGGPLNISALRCYLHLALSFMLVSWGPAGMLLPVALAAPTSVQIAQGVTMPTVSNGFISGIYSKGKNATQTIAAFKAWIVNGGRGIDTAFECKILLAWVHLLLSAPLVAGVDALNGPRDSCRRPQPG
jgi:hypothetical protein